MNASPQARCLVALLVGTMASLVACGKSSDGFTDEQPILGGDDAAVADGPLDCHSTFRCSRDLHSVEDGCTGQVRQECPPDQGCKDGACVEACFSAEGQQGTLGCSFWSVPSTGDRFSESEGGCWATVVANSWNAPLSIALEYDGSDVDLTNHAFIPRMDGTDVRYEPLTSPLPPGEVAVLFLSHTEAAVHPENYIACPMAPVLTVNPLPDGTGKGKAFHVRTDRPASIYSVYPYGGALSYIPSATVLVPEGALDTDYLAVDAWDHHQGTILGKLAVQIVATTDDTQVSIRMKEEMDLPPEWNAGAGSVKTFTLAKGELLQLMENVDFMGSPISANHPIAVFGGVSCFNVGGVLACDGAQQQIPPLKAWGREYAAVRYRNREELNIGNSAGDESVPWRIVAAVDDTILTYDPQTPFGAPTKLARGESAIFWSDEPFVVGTQDSEHPVYMAGYMTGGGKANSMGDPEFVNVVPTDQYLDSYTFFTDMTYEFTTLVVVRRNDGSGFKDVNLDCAGVIGNWTPIGTRGELEYAYVDMVVHQIPQKFAGGTCTNGAHTLRSDGTFMVTVWGFGPWSSYAYPGGAGLRPLSPIRAQLN